MKNCGTSERDNYTLGCLIEGWGGRLLIFQSFSEPRAPY